MYYFTRLQPSQYNRIKYSVEGDKNEKDIFNAAFYPGKRRYADERIPLSEKGKALAVSKRKYFQMWTDAFLHLIGEQWKRLNSSQITRSL